MAEEREAHRPKSTDAEALPALEQARADGRMETIMMIAESFDSRTLANMEVALERACRLLAVRPEEHSARRHIASKILECADSGDRTLGGLTAAGRIAARELRAPHRMTEKVGSASIADID